MNYHRFNASDTWDCDLNSDEIRRIQTHQFCPRNWKHNFLVIVCPLMTEHHLAPGHLQLQRWTSSGSVNTLRPRQMDFADIFKCIFLNENVWILIKISLKIVPKGPFNNIPAMVQIMAWRRPGDKPLSEPMVVNLLTHLYITRPQWVNELAHNSPKPNDAYKRHQTRPSLVQIMACRIFCTKPLPELMLAYCHLHP